MPRCAATLSKPDWSRSSLPEFNLTVDNAAAVARICHHLEGIPLALELAAARVRNLSPAEIADRLHDTLGLLVGGSRVAAPRQQTLQATIDWSYALLKPDERVLFEQLSVFAGGWTVDAAEVVCRVHRRPADSVVNVLARLADKSLVHIDRHDDGPVRYHMLQMLRQYGNHRLSQRAGAADVRREHAMYFFEGLERAGPIFEPPSTARWFDWIHQELDNLRVWQHGAPAGRIRTREEAPPGERDSGANWAIGVTWRMRCSPGATWP